MENRKNNPNEDYDLAYALSLHEEYNGVVVVSDLKSNSTVAEELQKKYIGDSGKKQRGNLRPEEIVDAHWELTDPNPDIHQLFLEYDSLFFGGKLVSSGVAVKWSNRMTLCAGVCSYEGRGGFCSIRLSQPILKLRPRKNLVETLLHEMIHAYLFVTDNNKDHDGHGPEFLAHMHRINKATGTKISVYHSFHQEVNQYRQHWWKCNGSCRKRPPYFGMVKRAMNRPPSPRDPWWAEHQRTCGGKYEKIKEPEGYGKKKKKEKGTQASSGCKDLRTMIKSKGENSSSSNPSNHDRKFSGSVSTAEPVPEAKDVSKSTTPFTGHGFILGSSANTKDEKQATMKSKILQAVEKRRMDSSEAQPLRKYKKSYSIASDQPGTARVPVYLADDSGSKQDRTNVNLSNDCIVVSPDKHSPATDPVEEILLIDDGDAEFIQEDDSEDLAKEIDLKTCPVCGMSNVPSAIINIHVSLCLDAEEEGMIVDD